MLSTLAAGAAQGGQMPGEPGEPMPWQANYHAQLAELLFDPQAPFHEKAVLALLEIGPKDVADKKVRARIAQGYRHVAFETGMHTAEGVRGLVVWGGKFSAPLLIELLEQNAMGAEEAIFAGLGDIATPEAAEAVVARIGASTGSEAAWACLRRMGPVAEGALVAALPFESPEANLAAIGVLGEVGTKKSNAILRLATKSENEGVAAAALDALREIRERDRATSDGE
jgi:HEAT repeat protein